MRVLLFFLLRLLLFLPAVMPGDRVTDWTTIKGWIEPEGDIYKEKNREWKEKWREGAWKKKLI